MHKGIHHAFVHSPHDTHATIKAVYCLSYSMPASHVQLHSACKGGWVNMRIGMVQDMRRGDSPQSM